jgi:translation initiation factor IF-3
LPRQPPISYSGSPNIDPRGLSTKGHLIAAKDLRINERIRVREVLVIDDEGQKLGVIPIQQALQMARDEGLDLVEVAPNANPPVCRILDYGKFKYEQSKKERDAHKHQRQVVVREVRFKSKIGQHDLDVKIRVITGLLKEGDKVKVSVLFRGREITHPEIGRDLLQRVLAKLTEDGAGQIEKHIGMEGRFMTMIVSPIAPKQVQKPKAPRAPRPAAVSESAQPAVSAMAAAMKSAGVAEGTPAETEAPVASPQ